MKFTVGFPQAKKTHLKFWVTIQFPLPIDPIDEKVFANFVGIVGELSSWFETLFHGEFLDRSVHFVVPESRHNHKASALEDHSTHCVKQARIRVIREPVLFCQYGIIRENTAIQQYGSRIIPYWSSFSIQFPYLACIHVGGILNYPVLFIHQIGPCILPVFV